MVPSLPPTIPNEQQESEPQNPESQKTESQNPESQKTESQKTEPVDSLRRSDRKRQEPTRYPDNKPEPKKEEV